MCPFTFLGIFKSPTHTKNILRTFEVDNIQELIARRTNKRTDKSNKSELLKAYVKNSRFSSLAFLITRSNAPTAIRLTNKGGHSGFPDDCGSGEAHQS